MKHRYVILFAACALALLPTIAAARLPAAHAQEAVNPLTGLPAADPAALERRPSAARPPTGGWPGNMAPRCWTGRR